ncbi:Hypothetical predicted protein [Lecanosticta acicola]|uniref:Uncharacterized protein n=1 Tax=Lecanosticta acicola TaxID=111012 RepID=A0AAI8YWP9_9PEZI|nr:Hypothetical predicted protein [Lecanosticta acicola]
MPFRIIPRPQPLRRVVGVVAPSAPTTTTTTRRAFTSTPRFRLKEDTPQSAEEIEAAKQEQLKTGRRKGELKSQSEAAVGADQQKVRDHGEHMADLQEQTAKQKQEEHPQGKS